jgi:hypothetical protein
MQFLTCLWLDISKLRVITAAPWVLSTWPCKRKLDEKLSKKIMPVLASVKWFWLSICAQDDAESGKRVEARTNTCC